LLVANSHLKNIAHFTIGFT